MRPSSLPRRVVLAVSSLAALATAGHAAARPPNVVLVVSDDQGYADLGFHGSKDIPTPHLDALAASGTVCTAGYVTFPVCSPSRAGFLSGRHGARFGYDTNPDQRTTNAHAAGLPLSERTMADALRAAGYRTGLVGKWHLGLEPYFHPNERGFDEFFGFVGGGHQYWQWKPGEGYTAPLIRNHDVVPGTEKRYLTDLLSDEAVAFVERNRAQPFFLYLAFNAPHSPLQASPEYLQRVPHLSGRRQIYAAMLVALDDGVGRLRQKLAELGLERDTLVLFISDNGGPLQDNASNNAPLRGHKSQVWEGGIRVPYVVSLPGKVGAGARYDRPVSTLDFLPTALALAGIDSRGKPGLEGVNLLPYLGGERPGDPHEYLYWRHRNGSWAVRSDDWKLVHEVDGKESLFNLTRDIGETTDLTKSQPDVAARLRAAWATWNTSNATSIPWLAPGKSFWPAKAQPDTP
jgi:arylsulfatase A-like enzyme